MNDKGTENFVNRSKQEKRKWYRKLSRRQLYVFLLCCCVNCTLGMSYSMQPLLLPKLAERKETPSTIYGFFIAVYELNLLIFCPIFGLFIRSIGRKFMYVSSGFLYGISMILYGLLEYSPPGLFFIFSCFIIKFVEGLGGAGYAIALFATISQEFSKDVSLAFSFVETLFGIGMIIGPVIGGVLFQYGKFIIPFATAGCLQIFAGILTFAFLPSSDTTGALPGGFTKLLRFLGVVINYFTVVAVAFSFAFNLTLLEPHCRQFNLTSVQLGFIFIIEGSMYLSSTPIWGFLASDRVDIHSSLLISCGGVFSAIAFILIGPAPYIPTDGVLWMTILALILYGIGTAPEYVISVIGMRKEALDNGYCDSIETSGLVSGLWTSGFALGSILGSSISGALGDAIGYRKTSQLVFAVQILVVTMNLGFYFWKRHSNVQKKGIKEEIPLNIIENNDNKLYSNEDVIKD